MLQQERAKEREHFGRHKGGGVGLRRMGSSFDVEDLPFDSESTAVEFLRYKLYPIHLPKPSTVVPGYKSLEKHVQAKRELETMATFFHPAM